VTHTWLFAHPLSSATRTPHEAPRSFPGWWRLPSSSMGGQQCVSERRGYGDTPLQTGSLGASARSAGRSSASEFPGLHGDAAGRLPRSATGVIHTRPCGWSLGDRLRAHVDNRVRRRRQPQERRSGLSGIRTPQEAKPAGSESIEGGHDSRSRHSALNTDRLSSMNRSTGVSTKTQAQNCPPKRGRSKTNTRLGSGCGRRTRPVGGAVASRAIGEAAIPCQRKSRRTVFSGGRATRLFWLPRS